MDLEVDTIWRGCSGWGGEGLPGVGGDCRGVDGSADGERRVRGGDEECVVTESKLWWGR